MGQIDWTLLLSVISIIGTIILGVLNFSNVRHKNETDLVGVAVDASNSWRQEANALREALREERRAREHDFRRFMIQNRRAIAAVKDLRYGVQILVVQLKSNGFEPLWELPGEVDLSIESIDRELAELAEAQNQSPK